MSKINAQSSKSGLYKLVLLILTKPGFEDVKEMLSKGEAVAWINSNIITDEELNLLRKNGADITIFTYGINSADTESINGALITVEEHYPGETVWVEHPARRYRLTRQAFCG